MTTQTIRERLAAPFAAGDVRVNRQAGFIDNVLICGTTSRNGRDYPLEVLRRDHAKYEGVNVNCDHKDSPTVADRVGWFSNVRPGSDGRPRGRLNVLKSHPMAERIFEAAERRPQLFGMSHVATCSTARRNGRETVESINKVISIDLVADPATTTSLYEGTMKRFREEASMIPAGSPVMTAAVEKLRSLVDQLEQGTIPLDDFEKWVGELLADTKKAGGVGENIPTTGEAFAAWLKGGTAVDGKTFAETLRGGPKVDGAQFVAWIKSGCNKTFAEFVAAPKRRGSVPTDGKAFAAMIKGY
jgi:hypothetical protein